MCFKISARDGRILSSNVKLSMMENSGFCSMDSMTTKCPITRIKLSTPAAALAAAAGDALTTRYEFGGSLDVSY